MIVKAVDGIVSIGVLGTVGGCPARFDLAGMVTLTAEAQAARAGRHEVGSPILTVASIL